jgi:hypothetical protein
MPTTKHELFDWLMDVPKDAEVGTDGEGVNLLASLGTNVHLLRLVAFQMQMNSMLSNQSRNDGDFGERG